MTCFLDYIPSFIAGERNILFVNENPDNNLYLVGFGQHRYSIIKE